MANLMGMRRYLAGEGMQGLSNAAGLQTQRENTKEQLQSAQDATQKSTTASMAGSGGILGYTAGPAVAGMFAPAAAAGQTVGGATTMAAANALGGEALGIGGTLAAPTAASTFGVGSGAAASGAAVGSTAGAAGAGAGAGTGAAVAAGSAGAGTAAGTGAGAGSMAGPVGAVAGLAIGALAGWLMTEFG